MVAAVLAELVHLACHAYRECVHRHAHRSAAERLAVTMVAAVLVDRVQKTCSVITAYVTHADRTVTTEHVAAMAAAELAEPVILQVFAMNPPVFVCLTELPENSCSKRRPSITMPIPIQNSIKNSTFQPPAFPFL